MADSLLDQEWQNISAVKSLFDSPGWQILEDHLQELYDFECAYCENASQNCIRPENLQDFNFHLAKKQTYKQILMMKEILIDENSSVEEADAISTSQDQQ